MACAVDWSSLPSDLVRRVADVFLATNDLDYYTSLRAVCHNWRVSTDSPRVMDPRFYPRRWVMVEKLVGNDGGIPRCLFLHVDAGRFLWKDLPILRNFTCVAFSEDGRLVLEAGSRLFILNPLTGHLLNLAVTTAQFFRANERGGRRVTQSIRDMFAAGSSPMVLYSRFGLGYGGCIDPTWDDAFNRESLFEAKPAVEELRAMVAFKGRAYAADMRGSVAVVEHICRLDQRPKVTTIVTALWKYNSLMTPTFLVDNAGELLLLRHVVFPIGRIQVFRVDIDNGSLELVKSIGNRAIFLGNQRCLSVDASNLPGIECNCIYRYGDGIFMHRIENGRSEKIFEIWDGWDMVEQGTMGQHCPERLASILMGYTYYDIMYLDAAVF